MTRFIEVALPVRLYRPLTYAIEGAWAEDVRLGSRVVVPLRKGRAVGVVTALDVAANGRAIRQVLDVPNEPAALPDGLLRTCQWIAQYYAAPIGLALRAALPTLLSSAQERAPKRRTTRVVRIARALPSLAERDALFGRARKQRALYELLESLGGSALLPLLRERGQASPSAIDGLVQRGLITLTAQETADPFSGVFEQQPAFLPTAAQREAIARITDSEAGGCCFSTA